MGACKRLQPEWDHEARGCVSGCHRASSLERGVGVCVPGTNRESDDPGAGLTIDTCIFPTADPHLHQPQSAAEAPGACTRAEVSGLIRVAAGVFMYPRAVCVRSCSGLAAAGLLVLAALNMSFAANGI